MIDTVFIPTARERLPALLVQTAVLSDARIEVLSQAEDHDRLVTVLAALRATGETARLHVTRTAGLQAQFNHAARIAAPRTGPFLWLEDDVWIPEADLLDDTPRGILPRRSVSSAGEVPDRRDPRYRHFGAVVLSDMDRCAREADALDTSRPGYDGRLIERLDLPTLPGPEAIHLTDPSLGSAFAAAYDEKGGNDLWTHTE